MCGVSLARPMQAVQLDLKDLAEDSYCKAFPGLRTESCSALHRTEDCSALPKGWSRSLESVHRFSPRNRPALPFAVVVPQRTTDCSALGASTCSGLRSTFVKVFWHQRETARFLAWRRCVGVCLSRMIALSLEGHLFTGR